MAKLIKQNQSRAAHCFDRSQTGFTLMEIVVSTTIFALVLTAMLTLFNYTLKINRRAEALRQVTQGMRNFTEFLVREVRNGKLDYSGTLPPCLNTYQTAQGYTTYIGVINATGERECISWDSVSKNMSFYKEGVASQVINPNYFNVVALRFYVLPATDPYCDPSTTCPGGQVPALQPFVTMVINFSVTLPSGETRTIPYQTTVSTDSYDVPHL